MGAVKPRPKNNRGKPIHELPKVEHVSPASLKFQRRNYRKHPDDQIEHLVQSIRENGFYRNVVVARDGTILAGHGVVQAARKIGRKLIPVVRLPLDADEPKAWKVMIGDNEISRMAEIDDRGLTELLKSISAVDPGALLGTGFDKAKLAALAMVTRPADEIADFDAAAHWSGMLEFKTGRAMIQLAIQFRNVHDRDRFLKRSGIIADNCRLSSGGAFWSTWWPPRKNDDRQSVKFKERAS